MSSIVVTSSPPLREQYKNLLRSEWSLQTLDESFGLLWAEIKDSPDPPQAAWWTFLAPGAGVPERPEDEPSVIERLRLFTSFFRDPVFPTIPSSFSKVEDGHIAAKAERTWTYLLLQGLAAVEGDVQLLADSQSVLFVCSIDYLLPEMRAAKLVSEVACLQNALHMHTMLVWRDNPAHYYYLQGLLMDDLKQARRRYDCLYRSFLLTPVEEHSYLTKAQALWSDLIDFGAYDSAEKFLLDLYRYSPRSYLPEVKDMIHSMYTSPSWKKW